ncbi:fibronectin type III domain-containing protein [Arthrobacter sp. IK3]|uniref:fibronectin type III domain-containing protein n=1 Tax=Arthrobacter sp. IK3 TaxID=3448169 RepID=UPI003EE3C6AB
MRKPPRTGIRGSSGAFDLPSIITGVVVVGILTAGVLAAIFGVIPYAQNNGSKQDLSAIRTAEGVAKAKDNRFMDHAGLLEAGYLQDSSTEKTRVKADAKGTCYVAVAKSGTGKIFIATDRNTDPEVYEEGLETGCLTDDELAELIDDIGGVDGVISNAPRGLKVTAVSALEAKAVWKPVSKATGYRVEYSIDNGAWVLLRADGTELGASVRAQPEQTVAVRVTALTDAGPTDPATASVKLPGSALKNPSFEQGLEHWTGGNASLTVGHTGSSAAKISKYSSLSQIVTVPVDKPVLTYWVRRDLGSSTAKIKMDNNLLPSDPVVVEGDWTQYLVNAHHLAGKTVNLVIEPNGLWVHVDDFDFLPVTVPHAPTEPSAYSTNGNATISWKAPVFSGGPAVSSYTVIAWKGSQAHGSVSVPGGTLTATMPGLDAGSRYTFTITATNDVGASKPSSTTTPVDIILTPIANPGFENGLSGWTYDSYWFKWLGGARTGSGSLGIQSNTYKATQTIHVPPETPVLALWSSDSSLKVFAGSQELAKQAVGAPEGAWQRYSVDLSRYAGRPISLGLGGSYHNFKVDDLELVAKN